MVFEVPSCAEYGAATHMCSGNAADAGLGTKHSASGPFYDLWWCFAFRYSYVDDTRIDITALT